ncbi:MAG: hypothetical protein OSB72_01470 [Gammaproteobacteria bacterium]|jgi:hypothetical protein|nr:hypothetical protein [Gammaproteobacteria bacterium]|tara:strand:+ start:639 stop:1862 length:1224 start_codon:yes stop_codon:yes gene_type:complete
MNLLNTGTTINLRISAFLLLFGLISGMFSNPLFAADNIETRGYVISMVHTASYADEQTCPSGTNGSRPDVLIRRVMADGYDREEAIRIINSVRINGGRDDAGNIVGTAITIGGGAAPGGIQSWNGLDFNPANIPGALPDPNAFNAEGRFSFGLNLDGEVGLDSWEHPNTGERGIDNQMWRVLGCWDNYHVNKPVNPYNETIAWDTAVDAMPAWLISISGEDLDQDGEVTVTFDRALNIPLRDAYGSIMSGASFALDTNPRSHNVFAGRIKGRVLTIEPGDFYIQGESQFYPHLRFTNTQLRFELKDDGSLEGHIGGYQPWRDYYHYLSVRGETDGMIDLIGIFYDLKRFADAAPDPATGENTAISSAYFIEAVPAFHVDGEGSLLAESVGAGPKFSGPAVSQYSNQQ